MEWLFPGFWLVLFVILLVIELATISLVSIWFCAGALAAFVLALIGLPFWSQGIVFAAVSVFCFGLLAEKVRGYFRFRHDPDINRSMLGQTGVVIEAIDPQTGQGRARFGSMDWKVSSKHPLPQGAAVKAIDLRGVTIWVDSCERPGKEKIS